MSIPNSYQPRPQLEQNKLLDYVVAGATTGITKEEDQKMLAYLSKAASRVDINQHFGAAAAADRIATRAKILEFAKDSSTTHGLREVISWAAGIVDTLQDAIKAFGRVEKELQAGPKITRPKTFTEVFEDTRQQRWDTSAIPTSTELPITQLTDTSNVWMGAKAAFASALAAKWVKSEDGVCKDRSIQWIAARAREAQVGLQSAGASILNLPITPKALGEFLDSDITARTLLPLGYLLVRKQVQDVGSRRMKKTYSLLSAHEGDSDNEGSDSSQ